MTKRSSDSDSSVTKLEKLRHMWEGHKTRKWPENITERDGHEIVMTERHISLAVGEFLTKGSLDLRQTSQLALNYHDAVYFGLRLNDEGARYFWTLEFMAELTLTLILRQETAKQADLEIT